MMVLDGRYAQRCVAEQGLAPSACNVTQSGAFPASRAEAKQQRTARVLTR
jgi:hypothetical protein